MLKVQRRKKFQEKDLIYLCHGDPYLKLTKDMPDGITLDLEAGIWYFKEDKEFGQKPFKIGSDTRYCREDHRWGPIGVYDKTRFKHLEHMAFVIQDASCCRCDNYDSL